MIPTTPSPKSLSCEAGWASIFWFVAGSITTNGLPLHAGSTLAIGGTLSGMVSERIVYSGPIPPVSVVSLMIESNS